VKIFARNWQDVHIRLRMNNKTVIFYINHMRGARSSNLSQPVCCGSGASKEEITLSAEHLSGSSNTDAHQESWTLQSSAEWMMDRAVCHKIFQILGPCQVDLEAKQSVEKVHQLASRSVCVGSRHLPDFMGAHGRICIPTFALIGRRLQKVLQKHCPVVLVAPVWDTQHWYPLFLKLLVVLPILLLVSESLLQDPFNRAHPLLLTGQVQLAAWKVSGSSIRGGYFRESYKPYLGKMEQED